MRSRSNNPMRTSGVGRSFGDARRTRGQGEYPGGGNGDGGGDSFTTVSYERAPSAGKKIGNSLQGLLIGPIMIILGCMLLWYNEGWAIRTHRSLNEALDAYIAMHDIHSVSTAEYQNELVHASGQLTAGAGVTDVEFGLQRSDAVVLERKVELYQWVQHVKKERRKLANGETEVREHVTYNKEWVTGAVASGQFRHPVGHENVGNLPVSSQKQTADQVKLGKLTLSSKLVQQLNRSRPVPIEEVKKLPAGSQTMGGSLYLLRGGGEATIAAPKTRALPDSDGSSIEETTITMDGVRKTLYKVKATGETFSTRQKALDAALAGSIEETTMTMDGHQTILYKVKATGETFSTRPKALQAAAKSQNQPQVDRNQGTMERRQDDQGRSLTMGSEFEIGDVRISFTEVPCTVVSVLAKLTASNMLTSWPSRQGHGYDVGMVQTGTVDAHEMIATAQSSNNVFTWVKRGGGWLLNFFGFAAITQVISTTAEIGLSWIPLLGPMTSSIINLGVSIANVILASSLSVTVAAVAWVVYRPFLGISMLMGSLGLFFAASQAGERHQGSSIPVGGKRFE